jgi:hypothetical protein
MEFSAMVTLSKEVMNNVWISRTPTLLHIAWRRRVMAGAWLSETLLFLLGAAFLAIPLLNLISGVFRKDPYSFKWTDLITLAFLLLGGLLVYRTLALLVNTDHLTVTPKELKVRSGPFQPWDGNQYTLAVNTIDSVDGKVISSRSGQDICHAGVSISYSVVALLTSGSSTTLVGGIARGEPIYFIAHEVITYLQLLRGGE